MGPVGEFQRQIIKLDLLGRGKPLALFSRRRGKVSFRPEKDIPRDSGKVSDAAEPVVPLCNAYVNSRPDS